MKFNKFFFLFTALFLSLGFTSFATEETSEKYWQEYIETAPEGSVSTDPEDIAFGVGVESLFSEILSALDDGIGKAGSFFLLLIGIALIVGRVGNSNRKRSAFKKFGGGNLGHIFGFDI